MVFSWDTLESSQPLAPTMKATLGNYLYGLWAGSRFKGFFPIWVFFLIIGTILVMVTLYSPLCTAVQHNNKQNASSLSPLYSWKDTHIRSLSLVLSNMRMKIHLWGTETSTSDLIYLACVTPPSLFDLASYLAICEACRFFFWPFFWQILQCITIVT